MPRSYPPRSAQRYSRSGSRSRHSHHNRDAESNRHSHDLESNRHGNPPRHNHGQNPDFPQSSWDKTRDHLVAMLSEFVGTVMFLWFAFAGAQAATQTSSTADTTRLVFVCLSFGFSLMVVAWVHYRISGGLFNPAVTLALCLTKNLPWVRGLILLPAQLVGGIVAAALVQCMFSGPITVVCSLTEGTSIAQGVFIEAFWTALLIFAVLMLAAEKHETTPFAPVGIGLALFVGELACVNFTSGALNPARAFGPSVVQPSFPRYHWIYWIGPLIGSLMASAYYGFNKWMNYEQVNPGQDAKRQ